jgi:hypothetical protein
VHRLAISIHLLLQPIEPIIPHHLIGIIIHPLHQAAIITVQAPQAHQTEAIAARAIAVVAAQVTVVAAVVATAAVAVADIADNVLI